MQRQGRLIVSSPHGLPRDLRAPQQIGGDLLGDLIVPGQLRDHPHPVLLAYLGRRGWPEHASAA